MKIKSRNAEKVIELMNRRVNRQVMLSLEACTHCGICAEQCHYVLTNPGDVTFAPAYKADRIRRLFSFHYGWTGRIFPWFAGAGDIYTDEDLEDLKDTVFGKCTGCRRCTLNCPMGVDIAIAVRMMRGVLCAVGVMPEGVAVVSKDQWELGNQMGVLREDYLETLEWLEEELRKEFGDPEIRVPVDRPDCDVVYSINPREIKYDPRTVSEAAAIFHFAGENWTMPGDAWDMTNFGLFSGDDALGGASARRLYDSVESLRGKKLVISECGHGYRSTRCEGQNWSGSDLSFPMESMIVTMLRYINEGRIIVDKRRNTIPVTYHDPCNNARSCGFTEEPRELLRLVCMDFREMYPNREENFCCTGGGGAMAMKEYTPRRLKSAAVKAEQLRATGAGIVVTSCHNCVDGLFDLIKHYKLGMQVKQLVNLVANAMEAPKVKGKKQFISEPEEAPVAAAAAAGDEPAGDARLGRILVIDDEPDIRRYLRRIFEGIGLHVTEAPDANQGMRSVVGNPPDLITLDLVMPKMTGEKLYWELKKDPKYAGIPVLIVSGYTQSDSVVNDFHNLVAEKNLPPPEGIFEKPIVPEAIADAALELIRLNKSR